MVQRTGLLVLAGLLAAGCSSTSQADLQRAKAAGASAEAQNQTQASLAAEVQRLQDAASKAATAPSSAPSSAPPAPSPAPAPAVPSVTSCGGNVSVGPNTSCSFGQTVANNYLYYGNGGTTYVQAYSPVTGQTYTMRCVSGVPVVCQGGNSAVVYIR